MRFATATIIFGVLTLSGGVSVAAPPSSTALQSERAERRAFTDQIRQLIRDRSFDELERIAQDLIKDDPRYGCGVSKLVDFYQALTPLQQNQLPVPDFKSDGAERRKEIYTAWAAAKPNSVWPKIGMSMAETTTAWDARGEKFAREVSPEKWETYKQHVALAWEWGQKALGSGTRDPELYGYMIDLCRNVGCPRKMVDGYLASAIALNRKYESVYVTMGNYLLPRWHGSPEEFTAFVEKSADDNKALGNILYARIAAVGMLQEGNDYRSVYPDLDWERIRSGLLETDKKYPNSTRTYHLLARFARLYEDRDAARDAMSRLSDRFDDDVANYWYSPYNFIEGRRWAMQGAPGNGTSEAVSARP